MTNNPFHREFEVAINPFYRSLVDHHLKEVHNEVDLWHINEDELVSFHPRKRAFLKWKTIYLYIYMSMLLSW